MEDPGDNFVAHEPCPNCGSSDNLGRYADGHAHCFGCAYYEPPSDAPRRASRRTKIAKNLIDPGEARALVKRGLTEETCRKWGYTVGDMGGRPVQIASYRDDAGNIVAQKVRFPDKDFTVLGSLKDALPLYGQWLWRDGGKMVVITEGEIDALTVSQLQGNKWPVASVPNGAQGAAKAVAKALDWLLKFDHVVFMLDMDEEGRAAAQKCAALLPPGRAKIASLPLKDASECLQNGKGGAVVDAIWGAKEFRPDGLVTLADLGDAILKPVEVGLPWWSDTLTKLTYGRRYGEVYCLGAGTGVGKTDLLTQQVVYDLTVLKQPVGLFFFEQQPTETARRVTGKYARKLFHVPGAGWTDEDLKQAWGDMRDLPLFMYDHFGASDWSTARDRIRYLRHAHGVRIFYLDHLTALAAGDDEDDERKALERIMAEVGGIVKELDVMLILVSHLATPEGKPHEEGGRVMIRHFKGARAIGFWCHFMFGLERNQQADDPEERTTTTFRVLKDRYTGQSAGQTFFLGYDADTGLLFERDAPGGFSDTTGDNEF